ncbi:hypothetical protein M231_00385 [Tremella mesenterica]|uniref:Uncharacterized protein n=1 Tax=Tremella mesenterica TaxID=5217 RepID=A0A4Q1BW60_TREME|nr:uncharacterized protein TREMEDRAFT_63470 [Tremella mesenterica DSM 1558]EIW68298.1 hypothetical protein TREMEDRAFT_63470 [Tremella mesenterica DSM 1558]RXK42395.1 hypothetical protein M231_00385 [Tremella mesenterica]
MPGDRESLITFACDNLPPLQPVDWKDLGPVLDPIPEDMERLMQKANEWHSRFLDALEGKSLEQNVPLHPPDGATQTGNRNERQQPGTIAGQPALITWTWGGGSAKVTCHSRVEAGTVQTFSQEWIPGPPTVQVIAQYTSLDGSFVLHANFQADAHLITINTVEDQIPRIVYQIEKSEHCVERVVSLDPQTAIRTTLYPDGTSTIALEWTGQTGSVSARPPTCSNSLTLPTLRLGQN